MNITAKRIVISSFLEHLKESGASTPNIDELISDLEFFMRYYSDSSEHSICLDKYDLAELGTIREAFRLCRARKIVKTIDMIIGSWSDLEGSVCDDLEIFCSSLVKYVDKHSEHKWLFMREDIYGVEYTIPYFLYHVGYHPAYHDKDGWFYEAYVELELHTNGINGFVKKHRQFSFNDVHMRTISQALKDKGIFVETKDLYEEYAALDKLYKAKIKEHGKQYRCRQYVEKSDQWSGFRKFKSGGGDKNALASYRVVNDRSGDSRHFSPYGESHLYSERGRVAKYEMPVVPFLSGYNLDCYCDCYFHVEDVEDYVYDHSLRDKLVLPESHRNLLDILVNNSSLLKGDIIENKGNGTVVILEGPPGCGKTLTTEVYSELIEKPLYKITSGQLGVDAKEMEKNLSDILYRAERLNCILSIDECETFVRKRGTDLMQNAIIAVFLRKIEYFNGIMFLTSNKIKDIDEAILSRCIAAIRYEPPTKENSAKIWRVLSRQFALEERLSDEMIGSLVEIFPTAVGRDIKELLKLTARYCEGLGTELSIPAFLSCAQFRYIDINEESVKRIMNNEKTE